MIFRRRNNLVLAIHFQPGGFAFVLFEGRLAPVDWGVYGARGVDKNTLCLSRIESLLTLHTPDVLVLQDMSDNGTRRAGRIRELNDDAAELADQHGLLVRTYSRAQVIQCFEEFGAVTKQGIAEALARHIPALSLFLPSVRRRWMSENPRMGIFDAAALAWMFFQSIDRRDSQED